MTTFTHASLSLLIGVAWLVHAPRVQAQSADPPPRDARVVFQTSPQHLMGDGVDVRIVPRNPALAEALPRARQLALRGSF